LIDKIIDFRNRIHKEDFRFTLTPEHWNILYSPESVEKRGVATVARNGELRGYAVYHLVNLGEARVYDVREIVAENEEVLTQLIDQVVDRSLKDDVDFVFARTCEDPYEKVYAKKGGLAFMESVVMVALLNPKEILSALSEDTKDGKILKLHIKGFDSVTVKVGTKGIMLAKNEKPDLTVSTDGKTFVRLFFGKTSFAKELFRRRISLSNISNWTTANHFFNLIKHDKWYIPMGDWV